MKQINSILLTVCASLLLASCASGAFYQVCKVTPVNEAATIRDNTLVFEDANFSITYDMWDDGGTVGFAMQNKTDADMYVRMDKTFFVLNGIAYDYFQNRITTRSISSANVNSTAMAMSGGNTAGNSSSGYMGARSSRWWSVGGLGATNTVANAAGSSVAYNEPKVVCIPAHTSKMFGGFVIARSAFRDCDLLRYPTTNPTDPFVFNAQNSPFVFENRIAYGKDSTNCMQITNSFYVSEIVNYPFATIIEHLPDSYCDQKLVATHPVFKFSSPSSFYIKYTRADGEVFIH